MNEDTIEREAFLYSLHPGKHLVPFYLWLSIRGYGSFDVPAAGQADPGTPTRFTSTRGAGNSVGE